MPERRPLPEVVVADLRDAQRRQLSQPLDVGGTALLLFSDCAAGM